MPCDEMAGQCLALHTNNTRERYVDSGQGRYDQGILIGVSGDASRIERSKAAEMVTMCQHYAHHQS